MVSRLKLVYQKLAHLGVDEATPSGMIDRIVFSNLICLTGIAVNFLLAILNVVNRYHHMLALNGVYFIAIFSCMYLNLRRLYLAGRLTLICLVFLGMLVSGLIQGPAIEIEHFFLPIAILGFSLFTREERRYSYLFLGLSALAYWILVNQSGPLLKINFTEYSTSDKVGNQFGYLTLFVACLLALSNSYERAANLIDLQRERLYEERRLATFGSMVGNVAHEINSPLAALDLQLYQLEKLMQKGEISREEISVRTERMRKISRRISVIVRGLKFISGQDAGDKFETVSLRSVIDSVLDLTRDRMEKEGIRFEARLADPDRMIACRPVALSQVFLNLLNNSLDAMEELPPGKRWIRLEDEVKGGRLLVSVVDGGVIESIEARENLFRNFYTTKASRRGTGLGLPISRETVQAHGGSLWFDQDSPTTRFVVELPLPEGAV